MTNRAMLWKPIKIRFVKPSIQSKYLHQWKIFHEADAKKLSTHLYSSENKGYRESEDLCPFFLYLTRDSNHNMDFLFIVQAIRSIWGSRFKKIATFSF